MMSKFNEKHVTINGEEIPYYPIDNDVNGNPRAVVHFRDLGIELDDYGKVPKLTKYRAKWFGGGYVFQCWNVKEDLSYQLKAVDDFYKKKEIDELLKDI